MKKLCIVLLLVPASVLFAQTRDDIHIHVPMPIGGTSEEQVFFQENFVTETIGAGYAVTDNQRESDYIIKLEIKPNMVMYEDGTEEQAPPGEPQKLLQLYLIRSEDNGEVVTFNFPYTEKEEMYDFNLYLLYQAMANVPLTKLTAVLETDHWRNKWLYVKGSFDFTISAYLIDEKKANYEWDPNANPAQMVPLKDPSHGREVPVSPGGTIGLEFQFLNWMSAEGDMKFIFGTPDEPALVPTIGLALKFPLKPSKHFMLEPYLGADFPLATSPYIRKFSLVSVGGGFQFGVRGGSMGAFFVDVNYMHSIGEIHTVRPNSRDAYWNRWVLGFGIGYKIGFFNRLKDPPPPAAY
jgi:hypothetical protein